MYTARSIKRGAAGTFLWFMEEVGELATAIASDNDGFSNRKNLEEEFADVLAWLCDLANVMDIDLETVLNEKFSKGCPACGNSPCNCSAKIAQENVHAQD